MSGFAHPDPYILLLTGFGLLTTLVVWLPLALSKLPLSLPIVCIALGAALFSLPQVTLRRLTMMVLLLLFGGALVSGPFASVGWTEIAVALVILLVVRPLTGLIGLARHRADRSEKLTLAFFGIRGVGSIYYLAYGLNDVDFAGGERLWGIVGLVVLFSILLHGLTVTPIMHSLGRDPDRDVPVVATTY